MINPREILTNLFVFFNPKFNYNEINLQTKKLIFIKKEKNNNENINNYIPCLFIPEFESSSKFLIFFHGNADDIFTSELFCQYFSEKLRMNVLIIEYPGYSIYNVEKSAQIMCEDSLIVYDYIKETFEVKDEDIYVVGRSLGTGPAVYLSSKRRPKNLFLISPFKSIKSIKNAFLSFFLLDIFKSIEIIDKIECQIFFIHGKNDPLIDYSHSEELFSKSKNINEENKNVIILNPEMTHNDMDIEKDIFNQIKKNLKDNPESFPKNTYNLSDIKFKNLFDYPPAVQKYLFKLNIDLSEPTKFEVTAKNAFKLKDGRIAFGLGNSEIIIYNIDWSFNEKELTIKIDSGSPIFFINQLKNNILVACDASNVYFYSLKKFKSEFINIFKCEDRVKKVEQLNTGEIIILCDNSIKILNESYKLINETKVNWNNLIVISNKIIVSNYDNNILIFQYINNKLISITIETKNFKTINSLNNLTILDNNKFIAIGKNQFLYYDLNDYSCRIYDYNISNPTNITKIDESSFLVWNKSGDIFYIEKGNGQFQQKMVKSINYENINSIIKLDDGSLIISKEPIVIGKTNDIDQCNIF